MTSDPPQIPINVPPYSNPQGVSPLTPPTPFNSYGRARAATAPQLIQTPPSNFHAAPNGTTTQVAANLHGPYSVNAGQRATSLPFSQNRQNGLPHQAWQEQNSSPPDVTSRNLVQSFNTFHISMANPPPRNDDRPPQNRSIDANRYGAIQGQTAPSNGPGTRSVSAQSPLMQSPNDSISSLPSDSSGTTLLSNPLMRHTSNGSEKKPPDQYQPRETTWGWIRANFSINEKMELGKGSFGKVYGVNPPRRCN